MDITAYPAYMWDKQRAYRHWQYTYTAGMGYVHVANFHIVCTLTYPAPIPISSLCHCFVILPAALGGAVWGPWVAGWDAFLSYREKGFLKIEISYCSRTSRREAQMSKKKGCGHEGQSSDKKGQAAACGA
eukprot:1093510-Pleurochrysis_carterae.AAC.1